MKDNKATNTSNTNETKEETKMEQQEVKQNEKENQQEVKQLDITELSIEQLEALLAEMKRQKLAEAGFAGKAAHTLKTAGKFAVYGLAVVGGFTILGHVLDAVQETPVAAISATDIPVTTTVVDGIETTTF